MCLKSNHLCCESVLFHLCHFFLQDAICQSGEVLEGPGINTWGDWSSWWLAVLYYYFNVKHCLQRPLQFRFHYFSFLYLKYFDKILKLNCFSFQDLLPSRSFRLWPSNQGPLTPGWPCLGRRCWSHRHQTTVLSNLNFAKNWLNWNTNFKWQQKIWCSFSCRSYNTQHIWEVRIH